MLHGTPVDLSAMLAAREARALRQRDLLARFHVPLLSYTLNIPGPVKTSADIRRAFDAGLDALTAALAKRNIPCIAREERHEATGDEAILALRAAPEEIKSIAVTLEETHPLGRLFDMDVLDAAGEKITRPIPRRCLLCGRQAQDCARSRRHSVTQLQEAVVQLLRAGCAAVSNA